MARTEYWPCYMIGRGVWGLPEDGLAWKAGVGAI